MNLYQVLGREYFPPTHRSRSHLLTSVFRTLDFKVQQQFPCPQVVNCLEVDAACSFLLSGEADGDVKFLSANAGQGSEVQLLQHKKFSSGFVTGLNWFPTDNGMFCVSYNNRLLVVDSNTFSACEVYVFGEKQLFWCDWNELDTNLIAVATCNSTVRLVDVRSGGSLHSLTLSSPLGAKSHDVTRVLWDGTDSEALFAADSSGCVHLYDIRATRKAVQIVSPDSHAFQTVTCLQRTPDSMAIITSHGMYNFFTLWHFRSKKLVNSNVHFQLPSRRKSVPRSGNVSGLIRTQVAMTGDLMFSPVAEGTGDVLVHDMTSGALIRTLDSDVYFAASGRKVNAVCGVGDLFPVLYSAGKSGIRVWTTELEDQRPKHEVHQDDWSDGE